MTDDGSGEPTPAGWYADAQGAYRWWDGTRWTEHTLPPPPPAAGAPATPAPDAPASSTRAGATSAGPPHSANDGRKALLIVLAVVVVLAVVTVPVLLLVLKSGDDSSQARDDTARTGSPTSSLTGTPTTSLTGLATIPPGGGESTTASSTPPTTATTPPTTPPTTATPAGRTPGQVLDDAYTRIFAGDCGFLDDTTAVFREQHDYTRARCRDDPDFFGTRDLSVCSVTVLSQEVTGQTASVDYLLDGPPCQRRGTASLVRQGGAWKVDSNG